MEQTNPLAQAGEIIDKAITELKQITQDPVYTNRIIPIASALERLKGPLIPFSGTSTSATLAPVAQPFDLAAHGIQKIDASRLNFDINDNDFLPVANGPIIDEKLEETNDLQQKVDNLWDIWDTITPEGIASDYANTPNGKIIVRTIFKRVGMEDFDKLPINIETISEVTKRKEAMAHKEAEEAEANRKLAEAKKLKQQKANA